MAMSAGGISKSKVATVIVAVDGTGDTADIQTGVNLLPATGGVVYVKEGTYAITAKIIFPVSNIKLVGAGISSVISISTDIDCIEIGAAISNIEIESVKLLQSGAINGYGVDLQGSNVVVRNCCFSNLNYGIYQGVGIYNNIVNCYFTLCNIGIVLSFYSEYSLRSLIFGNKFISNISHGIQLIKVDDIIISGNTFYNNGGDGINLYGTCNYNNINGNVIVANAGDGIDLRAVDDRNLIVGNQISANAGWGITIAAVTCDNNFVDGNVVYDNTLGNINDAGTGTVLGDNVTA